MNDDERDKIIRMAWEDRTTFDEIEKKTGLKEADVIIIKPDFLYSVDSSSTVVRHPR